MGNFLKGVLGGFSGKVGNVIGSSWKGIDYMRSLPRKTVNNATEEQLMQRLKFACTVAFVKPMSALVTLGFKGLAKQKISGYNVAVQRVLLKAITGDFPDYSIDHSKVEICEGSLFLPDNLKAQSLKPNTMEFSWTDNSSDGNNAKGDDNAMVLVYNPVKNRYVYNYKAATRAENSYNLLLPENFSGDEVHVYIGFITRDKRLISNSEYLGKVAVY